MTQTAMLQTKSSFADANLSHDISFPDEWQSVQSSNEVVRNDLVIVRAAIDRAKSRSDNLLETTPLESNKPNRIVLQPARSTETALRSVPHIQHVIPRVEPSVAASVFHALQEWEGYVTAIHQTEFFARLVDITAGASTEEEEARIPLAEISDDDAQRLRLGSIFRWVIGYERSSFGTKKRVSHIVLRDLPTLTRRDIRDGQTWAEEVIASLNS